MPSDTQMRLDASYQTQYTARIEVSLIPVKNDDDITGVGGDSSSGWTQAVNEGTSGDTYIELDVDLESRPHIGPVKLTLTGTQDNKDPDDDFRWAKKPSGACSTI